MSSHAGMLKPGRLLRTTRECADELKISPLWGSRLMMPALPESWVVLLCLWEKPHPVPWGGHQHCPSCSRTRREQSRRRRPNPVQRLWGHQAFREDSIKTATESAMWTEGNSRREELEFLAVCRRHWVPHSLHSCAMKCRFICKIWFWCNWQYGL